MYFEAFEVGKVYEHTLRRTVTQMDNMLFSNMTLNPQPLHIDRDFCEKETDWGQPLMNSLFTLGLMVGIGLAFVLELLDESIRTPEDVEKKLGLTLLGTIPRLDRGVAIAGLRDHAHVLLVRDHRGDPGTHDGVIVDGQYSNGHTV